MHEVGSEGGGSGRSLVAWLGSGMVQCALVVAASGGTREASVIALGAAGGRVCGARIGGLGALGVEEGHEHAFLHELVDFGHGLVQCGGMWGHVGIGESEEGVAYMGRKVDLLHISTRGPNTSSDPCVPDGYQGERDR